MRVEPHIAAKPKTFRARLTFFRRASPFFRTTETCTRASKLSARVFVPIDAFFADE
jgi:hypothetical protein